MKEVRQTFTEENYKERHSDVLAHEFTGSALKQIKILYFVACFSALFILSAYIAVFVIDHFNFEAGCVVGFIACYISYRFCKKYFVSPITIQLFHDRFIVKSNNIEVLFSDIISYKIAWMQGVRLDLTLKNGKKLKFISTRPLCETEGMERFVSEFDFRVISLIASNGLHANRKKSFLESKYALPFLVIMSIAMLIGIGWLVYIGGKITGALVGSGGALLSLWTAYFVAKNKTSR